MQTRAAARYNIKTACSKSCRSRYAWTVVKFVGFTFQQRGAFRARIFNSNALGARCPAKSARESPILGQCDKARPRSKVSIGVPSLRGLSHAGVKRSRRRRMFAAVKPDEPASNFQQRDNAYFASKIVRSVGPRFFLGLDQLKRQTLGRAASLHELRQTVRALAAPEPWIAHSRAAPNSGTSWQLYPGSVRKPAPPRVGSSLR